VDDLHRLSVSFGRQNTITAAQRYLNTYSPLQWKNMTYLPLKLETPVPSDLNIAKKQTPKDIKQLASEIHLHNSELELYGTKKAKIKLNVLERLRNAPNGKYIVVSGITPTPLGKRPQRLLHIDSNLYAFRRRKKYDYDWSLSGTWSTSEKERDRLLAST
jgi:hypothetical protein